MLYLRSVAVALRVVLLALVVMLIFPINVHSSDEFKTRPIMEEFDYEHLNRVAQDHRQPERLFIDYQFHSFVEHLSEVPSERAQTVLHILRQAIANYIAYTDTILTETQSKNIINEIHRITRAAHKYFISQNNHIAAQYFMRVRTKLPELILTEMTARDKLRNNIVDTTKTSLFPQNQEVILKDSLQYKVDIAPNETATVEYKDTLLEVSVREVPTLGTKGNLITLAPKDAPRRIFSLKVLKPSNDTKEALFLTTKHLLSHPKVSGMLFDDFLKVPSEMQSIAHERRTLGDKILLVRPVCSGLFSL